MTRFARLMAEALRRHMQTRGPVRLPDAGGFYWRAFADLSAARSYGPGGPMPISLEAIEAWVRLARVPLELRHVAVIRAMDAAFLEEAGKPPELTATAFDALLGA